MAYFSRIKKYGFVSEFEIEKENRKMDLNKAKQSFKEYVSHYDVKEPRIELKIVHMYHVAEKARKIAKSLGLSEEEQDLAELIGLLHDIGRFDQWEQYGTYSDKLSMDHGQKGVEILFGDKQIRNFIKEEMYDTIIYKAISNHNKFEIEKGLSQEEMLYCKIVRDADNLDIFRMVLESKPEDYGHLGSRDVSKEVLSPAFFEDFQKERPLLYSKAKTDMDIMVAIIAHIYTINFTETLRIIQENNYIDCFVKHIHAQDENYTKPKMDEIANYARNYINRKLEE